MFVQKIQAGNFGFMQCNMLSVFKMVAYLI